MAGDSLDLMHELIPFESVLCLNQSALIKCIICHIFTYLLVAICIKRITSANKKSCIIYLTKLSWFSLQFLIQEVENAVDTCMTYEVIFDSFALLELFKVEYVLRKVNYVFLLYTFKVQTLKIMLLLMI